MLIRFVTVMVFCVMLVAGVAQGADAVVLAHQAVLSFDIENHTVQIKDTLLVPPGVQNLRLGDAFAVHSLVGPHGPMDPALAVKKAEDEDGPFLDISLAACGLGPSGGLLELEYSGTLFESVENVSFSRENVGNEITATISDEGIYLSGMAEWLAWGEDLLATHDISCDTPAGFETVTQGRRTEYQVQGERLHTRWVAANPADGLNLIANRYFVHEEPVHEGIVSQTFFLEDDKRLRDTYMERTKAYIKMYEEMIGPYPYSKFATVENWFPTGYGMPSYTLLGGQVLRLPFIPYTSFGHEILHNWWGNSVFVNLDEGNWCEGLTVYCADYHYKELQGDEPARQYRRTLLKDYEAYIKDPAHDFPLNEFLSRHSGATRAVGYGKSMMVFHMIDRTIGREAFLAGLQAVAAEHKYVKAGWSDFFAAFAKASNHDFDGFKKQWLERTGAPALGLSEVVFEQDRVSFLLHQGAPPYDLQVPVVVTTKQGPREHLVTFDKMRERFEIKVEGALELAVDPDCHLFRRLNRLEIEPTISQVLASIGPTIVIDHAPPLMANAARKFAEGFIEQPLYAFVEDGILPADAPKGTGPPNIVINPGAELLGLYQNPELVISGKTVFLGGKRFSLDKYDLVFCASNPHDDAGTDMIILCDGPHRLESLARRLGHYGKYSYLVFPSGQGDVEKGNWQPGQSPLTVKR